MQTGNMMIQNGPSDMNSGKRYLFEFEQLSWNKQTFKCALTEEAQKKIEEERKNIEKDLMILNAIEQEKLRETNLMVLLLQMKGELEQKLNKTESV